MRKKIAAGNWKMNLLAHQAAELANELDHFSSKENTACRICIFPPALYLPSLSANLKHVEIGAQNFYPKETGAFTGEISMSQLSSIGVKKVLVGHSERRSIFHEEDQFINQKIQFALENEAEVFFCIGEVLEDRKSNSHFDIVREQIEKGLKGIELYQMSSLVIAYEPVWAIGTGETASPEQAQEMHAAIRSKLADMFSNDTAQNTSILYGGSVKPSNARELFDQEDVDGGLVGGASLSAPDFIEIINALK
ncbi:MAG: triose-phosphate isomerase [Bacteroidota bacterium]